MRPLASLRVLGVSALLLGIFIASANQPIALAQPVLLPNVASMPDNQQPDSQIIVNYPPGTLPPPPRLCVTWPNYCAPVSAVNIWQFYDLRDGLQVAPWVVGAGMDDLPVPGPPVGWSMSWSSATIQGQGANPAAARLPLHMRTNDVPGCFGSGPAWAGTKIYHCFFGALSYLWAEENANGLSKKRYVINTAIDESWVYVPDDPGGVVDVIQELVSFPSYTGAINADQPAIVAFGRWVDPASKCIVDHGGIVVEYYLFSSTVGGNPGGGDNEWEEWAEDAGHAVTGIGYMLGFDPDAQGPLPLADWYIVRDNWMTTGANVAVPVGTPWWLASIFYDTPVEPEPGNGYVSPLVAEVDFAVDTDFGPPTGLFGSDVYNEELIGEDAENDFYLTAFPPGVTNIKTMDENVPSNPAVIPPEFLPALLLGTPAPAENTDALCFGVADITGQWEWCATGGSACIAPDNGTGTVALPAICPFEMTNNPLYIIDGLPPGTTIEAPFVMDPLPCLGAPCESPGGTLGGNMHLFQATLSLNMVGTGSLSGWTRSIPLPMVCEVHTAPRTPGDPIQTFASVMFSMQGQVTGDPDFDLLRVTAGDNFGLPSPGQSTLTQLPDGTYAVESFFDITYRIDFVGAPGSVLAGMSGSTTGSSRFEQGGVDQTVLDAAVRQGMLHIQFAVEPFSLGLPGSAVRYEATRPAAEAAGDVFEALPGGLRNALIADEYTLGLEDQPLDDVNALVVPDEVVAAAGIAEGTPGSIVIMGTPPFASLPLLVDTDGDQAADSPRVFFSIRNSILPGSLGGGVIGDWILMTPPYNAGNRADLNTCTAWTASELGLVGPGLDEIDALYIEWPFGGDVGGGQGYPLVYFSLAAGSEALSNGAVPSPIFNPFTGGFGCDPGDIIAVRPAGAAGVRTGLLPVCGPVVVIQASTLGLRGDGIANDGTANEDDLNGVHVAFEAFAADVDVDGLDDGWEYQHGVGDPAGDEDGDGLDNASEYANRTDPNDKDSDDDGFSDKQEVDAGTDPNDPTSNTPFSPVWVDFGWTGIEKGTEAEPTSTLADAVQQVLTSGTINLKGNVAVTESAETPRITKAMRLAAVNGGVRVGVQP